MLTGKRIRNGAARRAQDAIRCASGLLLVVGGSACAADEATADDGKLGEGEVATDEGVLSANDDATPELAYSSQPAAQSNAVIFGVSKGEYDLRLKPVSTHECFLTRISGELDDDHSSVALHYSTNDGADGLDELYGNNILDSKGDTWKLWSTNGGSRSLSAEATCVPHSDFLLDPGMIIQSGPIKTVAVDDWTKQNQDLLANGDAVASINHLMGNFRGGGEYVEILTAPPDRPSVLRVGIESPGHHEGTANSFFVGRPGVTVTRRSPPVRSSGNKKTNLIQTKDGVCYLTRFSGDFNGSEERVRIAPAINDKGIERWVLETHAGSGKAYATAECVYYDQRLDRNPCGEFCL